MAYSAPERLKPQQLQRLNLIDPGRWAAREVPVRKWVAPGLVPANNVVLLSGDGAIGKSTLAMQLLAGVCLTGRWVGRDVPRMKALGLFCEDDEDELHRRMAAICAQAGADMSDLSENLHVICGVGEDNTLVNFDRYSDTAMPTPLYDQITQLIRDAGIELVLIDTAADTFGGNENIRNQVRTYINLLRKWVLTGNGAVILTSHPSIQGIASGTGISGSTAWNNSVRARLYFTVPKPPDGEEQHGQVMSDERILTTKKSNYGPTGEVINLRWKEGVFVYEPGASAPDGMMARYEIDVAVLAAVEWLLEKRDARLALNPKARNGLVGAVRQVPSCKKLRGADIEAAQDRLIESGKLVRVEIGSPSKTYVFVRTPNHRYPGERPYNPLFGGGDEAP